ncbi:uroporphyrinogen-III C-methyltransferase [Aeromonas schubertii]|uniref:Uroporphyrinogen-III C-methyltransferase n=1 Tax=Aeromonas schubertii TaxID=652 RepID=A0ABS7V9C6_9GAMM|nr:uroporphyrinogen-III C-methyltransferase [Aeromonas schubertii]MBZ6065972.1 uroporphyrinogen-III C-methyltransferase [Aeromonas schubertii]
MTEEQKQPATAQEAPTESQQAAQPRSDGGRAGLVLGSLAIALTLGLTGWTYVHGHQRGVAQQAEMASLKSQLSSASGELDALKAALSQDQQGQQKNLQLLQSEMSSLQSRVLDLNEKRPNDWLLAESEYLVRMAGRKLWLEHDLVSAVTMLANADERIKALGDPSLMPIRKAMAEDIAKLKALPTLDREGLTLKLAALSDQIDLLPMNAVAMPETVGQADQAVSGKLDDWQSNLKKNWVHFTENFVTIRRRDGAVEALLSPQQEIYLRENLKTKLLQAQLAVYREQQDLYADSLEKAQRWVKQYFNQEDSATRYVLAEIDKLKDEQIQFNYPERLQTQALLEQVLNDRLQRLLAGH